MKMRWNTRYCEVVAPTVRASGRVDGEAALLVPSMGVVVWCLSDEDVPGPCNGWCCVVP